MNKPDYAIGAALAGSLLVALPVYAARNVGKEAP